MNMITLKCVEGRAGSWCAIHG